MFLKFSFFLFHWADASPCTECDSENKALWTCGADAANGVCSGLDNQDSVDNSDPDGDSALEVCLIKMGLSAAAAAARTFSRRPGYGWTLLYK